MVSLSDDGDHYQSFCTQTNKHQIDCGTSIKQLLAQTWMSDLIFWTQLVQLGTSSYSYVVQCMMHVWEVFPVSLMYFTIHKAHFCALVCIAAVNCNAHFIIRIKPHQFQKSSTDHNKVLQA